jgi:hypothetical protein
MLSKEDMSKGILVSSLHPKYIRRICEDDLTYLVFMSTEQEQSILVSYIRAKYTRSTCEAHYMYAGGFMNKGENEQSNVVSQEHEQSVVQAYMGRT